MMPINETKSPRQQLEHDIRNIFSTGVSDYYRKYPDRIDDPRTTEGIKVLLALMTAVIRLLDKYDIQIRPRTQRKEDVHPPRTAE